MVLFITLVRHAQTTMNQDKLVQTRTDALLTEQGARQAELLGKHLQDDKYDEVYTSDKTRTIQTANLILKSNNNQPTSTLISDPRLRERDFGLWEGRSVLDLHDASAKAEIRMHRFNQDVDETYEDYKLKCTDFFQELCASKLNKEKDCNILIVSHGGWIFTFFDVLSENNEMYILEDFTLNESNRSPLNTSYSKFAISKVEGENGKLKIKFFKICDSSHLI